MPWGFAIGAAGAIGGALISSDAAGDAADTQAQAGRDSNATQLKMYEQTRADQQPWRQAGEGALSQLSAGLNPGGGFAHDFSMADYVADPGYQFRLDQGLRGVQGSAAARGSLFSGGTLKALTRYGQDTASQEYSNAYSRFNNDRTTRFNRLGSLAGIGQTATNFTGQIGANTAGAIAGTQQGIGNVQASGQVGSANAINAGLTSAGNSLASWYAKQNTPSSASAWGSGTSNPYGGTAADPWYG